MLTALLSLLILPGCSQEGPTLPSAPEAPALLHVRHPGTCTPDIPLVDPEGQAPKPGVVSCAPTRTSDGWGSCPGWDEWCWRIKLGEADYEGQVTCRSGDCALAVALAPGAPVSLLASSPGWTSAWKQGIAQAWARPNSNPNVLPGLRVELTAQERETLQGCLRSETDEAGAEWRVELTTPDEPNRVTGLWVSRRDCGALLDAWALRWKDLAGTFPETVLLAAQVRKPRPTSPKEDQCH